jgi:hypothetical protein
MERNSDLINSNNRSFIKAQIDKKLNYNTAYFGRTNTVQNVVTDMDNFPYNRFYRGRYDSDLPIVFDREAGWRPLNNSCYRPVYSYVQPNYPDHCFQASCDIVYPCIPGYLRKWADKDELDIMLNRTCVEKSP